MGIYALQTGGVHFELVTDSKVAAALLTKDTCPPRRENFIARMMEFDFTPVHRKGALNRNAAVGEYDTKNTRTSRR